MDAPDSASYGDSRIAHSENTDQRQIVTSLLLVLALALLGLPRRGAEASAVGGAGPVFHHAKKHVFALRSLETKPSARKVHQPFAPHLACHGPDDLLRECGLYSLFHFQQKDRVADSLRFGDLRGRAPPHVNQA